MLLRSLVDIARVCCRLDTPRQFSLGLRIGIDENEIWFRLHYVGAGVHIRSLTACVLPHLVVFLTLAYRVLNF